MAQQSRSQTSINAATAAAPSIGPAVRRGAPSPDEVDVTVDVSVVTSAPLEEGVLDEVEVTVLFTLDSTELRATDSELMTLLIEAIAVLTSVCADEAGLPNVLVMVVKSLLLSVLVMVVRPLLAGTVVVETPPVAPPTTP